MVPTSVVVAIQKPKQKKASDVVVKKPKKNVKCKISSSVMVSSPLKPISKELDKPQKTSFDLKVSISKEKDYVIGGLFKLEKGRPVLKKWTIKLK